MAKNSKKDTPEQLISAVETALGEHPADLRFIASENARHASELVELMDVIREAAAGDAPNMVRINSLARIAQDIAFALAETATIAVSDMRVAMRDSGIVDHWTGGDHE